jgi:hypothetical protein
MTDALDTIRAIKAKFYHSDPFSRFYTPDYRLKQIKKSLSDKRTTASERLQWIKYLDAHVGDVPATGPESGKFQGVIRVVYEDRPTPSADDDGSD